MEETRMSARGFFVALVVATSLAFAWLVMPFSGAILWAVVAAVLFAPLHARLLAAMPGRRNRAALAGLVVIVVVVVVPAILLGLALLDEARAVYARIERGGIDLGTLFDRVQAILPGWARDRLVQAGLGDVDGLHARFDRLMTSSFQTMAGRVLSIGQGALGFFLALGVMLYLTFFLLRDGRALATRVERAIPLPPDLRALLLSRFVTVVRATIKGSLVVAVLQGLVGGLTFWLLGLPGALLWGVAMGVFSLFPAIGTGIVWVPVTLVLLASGAIWQGVALFLCGFFIISSVDNIVRPVLVGRDAQMPDYVVLIATLGGFELMGFNGFVVGPMIAALFLAVWDIVIGENAREDEEGANGRP
ncbi:MAG TPA: AI-2E family transporter [Novosphingobium capsulatum]|nr:AI-2E family transporter [Novosphingobium capsulatum]